MAELEIDARKSNRTGVHGQSDRLSEDDKAAGFSAPVTVAANHASPNDPVLVEAEGAISPSLHPTTSTTRNAPPNSRHFPRRIISSPANHTPRYRNPSIPPNPSTPAAATAKASPITTATTTATLSHDSQDSILPARPEPARPEPARPEPAHLRTSGSRSRCTPIISNFTPLFTASSATVNECCAPPAQAHKSPKDESKTKSKMGLSKSQRIGILLAIDTAFFLVEIVVGYAVHSLALVADAFHMLNDVLSLCVGLWAVRVANQGSSKMYTYGWQRAETLGALVNGVFLVALCLSIFLEAIQRFVEVQEVSNPKLVLIVGCMGLASNILGLFLFHDHGHSHGDGDHSHAEDPVTAAEEGHVHDHAHAHDPSTDTVKDPHGNIADVLPQIRVAGDTPSSGQDFTKADEENATLSTKSISTPSRKSVQNADVHPRQRRRTSGSFGRGFGSVDNIHVHPSFFRDNIIQAAKLEERAESDQSEEEEALFDTDLLPNETSRILSHPTTPSPKKKNYGGVRKRSSVYDHSHHQHSQPKDSHAHSHGGHGHSHGDLNMRGVFLHVMGDALGNIGVIASALIIWLCSFKGRFYFDPAISLVITVIILTSAIPLCKAASRILLQAVPHGLSIDEIKEDIEDLDRVLECHHLHVWQLSDTKLIASLHVKVDCEVDGTGSASYMHLAREIRRCLHGYGIHSSTIQPEFTTGTNEAQVQAGGNGTLSPNQGGNGSKAGSLNDCLLDCGDNCASGKMCCPTGSDGGKSK